MASQLKVQLEEARRVTSEEKRKELAVALGLSGDIAHEYSWKELLAVVVNDRQQLAKIKAIVE